MTSIFEAAIRPITLMGANTAADHLFLYQVTNLYTLMVHFIDFCRIDFDFGGIRPQICH